MACAPRLGAASSVLVLLAALASVLLVANLRAPPSVAFADAPAVAVADAITAGEEHAQPVLLPLRSPALPLPPRLASNRSAPTPIEPARLRGASPRRRRGYDPSSWQCENVLETLGVEGVLAADARHDDAPFANRKPFLDAHRQPVTPLPPGAPSRARPARPDGGCVLLAYFHFDKTGGTFLREALDRLDAGCPALRDPDGSLGLCAGPHVVRLDEHTYQRAWLENAAARAARPRAWVEVHSGRFDEHLARLEAARAALAGECRVLTVTLIREPVEQLASAHRYWGVRMGRFNGSLSAYAAALGSVEHGALPAAVGEPGGARADWFLGRVKFQRRAQDATRARRGFVDENVCNQPQGVTCARACYAQLDGFLRALDIVAPTSEWETFFLHLARELGLRALPLAFRLGACLRLLADRMAAAPAAAAVAARRARDVEALQLAVPCSARVYAKYAARYGRWARRAVWADARARARVCALEAQYTCHLRHGALDDAQAERARRALFLMRMGGRGPRRRAQEPDDDDSRNVTRTV